MAFEAIVEKRLYGRAERLADEVWALVEPWDWKATKTVGVQLIRAADSVGANVAEAYGRYHPGEARQFLFYARGSLRETQWWLRRAAARKLIAAQTGSDLEALVEALSKDLNASINHQKTRVSEPDVQYTTAPTGLNGQTDP